MLHAMPARVIGKMISKCMSPSGIYMEKWTWIDLIWTFEQGRLSMVKKNVNYTKENISLSCCTSDTLKYGFWCPCARFLFFHWDEGLFGMFMLFYWILFLLMPGIKIRTTFTFLQGQPTVPFLQFKISSNTYKYDCTALHEISPFSRFYHKNKMAK